jgi:hypothetical protein
MSAFKKMIESMDKEHIDSVQELDFDLLNFTLQQFPQGLYDMLYLDPVHDELDDNEVKERKAVLDAAYVYLQSTMEEIGKVLREKYPEEMNSVQNRLNF